MTLTRRTIIKTGAVAAAASLAKTASAAQGASKLAIFDSRSLTSRAFARTMRGQKIDIAGADANFWYSVRSIKTAGTISGMTGWNDWVIIRGYLEEKGKRVKSETAHGRLFRWTMV